MTDARARVHAMFPLDEHATTELDLRLDALAAEATAERDAMTVAWLVKKAREYPRRNKLGRTQADVALVLASKIRRGAVRPDNLRMLPNPGFFEPGHTYTREHHGDTIRFLVEYISTSPDGRYTVAHGWRNRSWEPGWEPSDSDDFTGWTDITEGGQVAESQHYDKVPDPADGCHWCACGNRWPCKHAAAVTG